MSKSFARTLSKMSPQQMMAEYDLVLRRKSKLGSNARSMLIQVVHHMIDDYVRRLTPSEVMEHHQLLLGGKPQMPPYGTEQLAKKIIKGIEQGWLLSDDDGNLSLPPSESVSSDLSELSPITASQHNQNA